MSPADGHLLEVRGLAVAYGQAGLALQGVDLELTAGDMVAVLGANGAGKTTLIRAICGTHRYYGGRVVDGTIRVDGRDVTGSSPGQMVAQGLVQVPEGRRVLPQLTVEENLRAGLVGAGKSIRQGGTLDSVYELFPVLADRRKQRAGYLSGGEQQMVAIGRALCADPRLLILDEPTLGLAPKLIERVADTIRGLNERGVSVLLVEQNAAVALNLCQRAYVLRLGSIATHGDTATLAGSEEIASAYLGEDAESATALGAVAQGTDGDPAPGEVVLTATDLRVNFGALTALDGIDLAARRGQITGLIGPNGAGKTTLINCVMGAVTYRGEIRLRDRPMNGRSTADIARAGVSRTFQHPAAPSGLTVRELVLMARDRSMSGTLVAAGLRTSWREERDNGAVVDALLDDLRLSEYAETVVDACPYGVQKRVDLARALALEPVVLLLDEPFAGLQLAESLEMLEVVRRAMDEKGVAVVLVDHKVEVVLGCANQVTVIDFGVEIASGVPSVVRTDATVRSAYLGHNF